MIFGMLAIWLALAGTLVSAFTYFGWMIAERRGETGGKKDKEEAEKVAATLSPLARWGFAFSFAMLLLAILQLETAAYRHDFSLSYIARFSSRDEPKSYLFATLWAGQEGTFLLWCTYVTLLGLIVRRYARSWEASVMFFLNLIRLSLLIVLVGKSPFAPTVAMLPVALQGASISTLQRSVWAFFHSGALNYVMLPADGQGLNPLLQNSWMRIHPPTLFFGFSATSVPFAFAMSALWKKDYKTWVRRALPWTALAFAVLGTGIMLGGYWAYSVLGWGGFWGWDPVENSSKVPWLMTVLLLHGMLMQQRKNTWHRATALFGILPFLMVMFSSFLTRSGILENFSVHSFGKEDDLFPYLIGPLIFFWVIGIGLWLTRWKSFPKNGEPKPMSVPALLSWGIGTVALYSFLVWTGMSSPLLTGIAAGLREKLPFLTFLPSATSNVSQGYYNYVSTPLVIFAALLMFSIPFLSWERTDLNRTYKKGFVPLGLALLVTLIALAYGVGRNHPSFELYRWGAPGDQYRLVLPAAVPLLSLVFAGAMAIFSSLQVVFFAPQKIGRLGGFLSHAGIGVLLIGVVCSELSGTSQRVSVTKGEPTKAMGYDIAYDGLYTPVPGGKQALNLSFTRGDEKFSAPTPMYFSKYNQQYMYAPFIRKYPGYDLYIAPEGPPMSTADMAKRQVEMMPGQTTDLINGVSVKFVQFDAAGHTGSKISVGAVLDVMKDGKTTRIEPKWEAEPTSQTRESLPAETAGRDVTAEISDLNADTRSATIIFGGHALGEPFGAPQEIELLTISTKPMINLVWLATLFVMCGGLLTVKRAFEDLHRSEARDRDDETPPSPPTPEDAPEGPGEPRKAKEKELAGVSFMKKRVSRS
jgi:cytochrome c-type biogenesis protein CcmF